MIIIVWSWWIKARIMRKFWANFWRGGSFILVFKIREFSSRGRMKILMFAFIINWRLSLLFLLFILRCDTEERVLRSFLLLLFGLGSLKIAYTLWFSFIERCYASLEFAFELLILVYPSSQNSWRVFLCPVLLHLSVSIRTL